MREARVRVDPGVEDTRAAGNLQVRLQVGRRLRDRRRRPRNPAPRHHRVAEVEAETEAAGQAVRLDQEGTKLNRNEFNENDNIL